MCKNNLRGRKQGEAIVRAIYQAKDQKIHGVMLRHSANQLLSPEDRMGRDDDKQRLSHLKKRKVVEFIPDFSSRDRGDGWYVLGKEYMEYGAKAQEYIARYDDE